MNVYPLETPLHRLPYDTIVWVVRRGLVFPYPAQILRDIANDRYIVDDGPALVRDDSGYGAGWFSHLLRTRRLEEGSEALWYAAAPCGGAGAFAWWWESVFTGPGAEDTLGAAIGFAARNTMTVSAFSHRFGIDIRAMSA